MLVLSRKQGDIIKIGDDIEVRIIEVKGRSIRLGIRAKSSLEISSVTSGQLSRHSLDKDIEKKQRTLSHKKEFIGEDSLA